MKLTADDLEREAFLEACRAQYESIKDPEGAAERARRKYADQQFFRRFIDPEGKLK